MGTKGQVRQTYLTAAPLAPEESAEVGLTSRRSQPMVRGPSPLSVAGDRSLRGLLPDGSVVKRGVSRSWRTLSAPRDHPAGSGGGGDRSPPLTIVAV